MRRRRDLAKIWTANVAAVAPLQGDLVHELIIAIARDDLDRANQRIIDAQLFEESEIAEDLSGL